jgi:hypothetical protein
MCLNEWGAVVHLAVKHDPAIVDCIVFFDFVARKLVQSLPGLWHIFGFSSCFLFSLLLVLVPFLSHLGCRLCHVNIIVLVVCVCFFRRPLLMPGHWADGYGLCLCFLVIPINCIQHQLRWSLLYMHSHVRSLLTRLSSHLPLRIRNLNSSLLLLGAPYNLYRGSILLSQLRPLFNLRRILQRIQVIRILQLTLQMKFTFKLLIDKFTLLLSCHRLYRM